MDGEQLFILQYAVAILVVVLIVTIVIWAVRRSASRLQESRRRLFGGAAKQLNMQFYEKDPFNVSRLLSRFKMFETAANERLVNLAVRDERGSQNYLCEYTQSSKAGINSTASVAAKFTLSVIQDRRLPETSIVIMPSSYERLKGLALHTFGKDLQDVTAVLGMDKSAGFWIFTSDPQQAKSRLDKRRCSEIVSALSGFGLDLAVQIADRVLVVHTLSEKKRVDDIDQLVRFVERAKQIHEVFVTSHSSS